MYSLGYDYSRRTDNDDKSRNRTVLKVVIGTIRIITTEIYSRKDGSIGCYVRVRWMELRDSSRAIVLRCNVTAINQFLVYAYCYVVVYIRISYCTYCTFSTRCRRLRVFEAG